MRVTHETAHRFLMGGSILMFLVAILGAVGEVLDWWDAFGEVLMTVGTLGGLVLGGVDFFRGASEGQVQAVKGRLGSVDGKLDRLGTMDGKLDQLETMDSKLDQLETMDSKLDQLKTMDGKLDTIEAALVEEDGKTSKLDVVQVELDRQTGVLDRQVDLLGEIRDKL